MKMILFFKSRIFWFNLILAFVFLISLMLPLNWVLKQITGHGEIQNVPDVRNITLKEAQQTLENMQLIGEVLDSSAFFKNFKPGTVVQQYPEPGAGAKVGRKIKLTINRHRAESVYLPILTERTFERATSDLRSRGLVLGQVSYRPDLAEGIVLGAKANGKFINGGDLIRKGTVVDLLVGQISGPPTHSVPNVISFSLKHAVVAIQKADLQIQVMDGDQNNLDASIIKQNPIGSDGNLVVHTGGVIQVWLSDLKELNN